MSVPVRVLATAAVWAIFSVGSARLRHPVVWIGLGGLALSVTVLIWSDPPRKPGGE